MKLALFDLDETLICGDSDNLWHDILLDNHLVDARGHRQKKQDYYQQYLEYRLDIHEYLAFSMNYLTGKTVGEIAPLRAKIIEHIQPIVWQHTNKLLEAHSRAGFDLAIITTTNAFISAPVAEMFGTHIIATQPEVINGRYTGKPMPPIVEGKTKTAVLERWLAGRGYTLDALETSFFYTDSYNDFDLLEKVHTPVVVNGDARLQEHASKNGWQCLAHEIDDEPFAQFLDIYF